MINSIDDHLASLYRLRRFGIKFGLSTISRIMRGLGDPHKKYPCIHIAGTNGKGSVSSYIASILTHSGYRTGLYTSPHLVRFNERFQINGELISDDDLVHIADAVTKVYAQSEPPTFFEAATAMAFYYFAKKNVDWSVIETGMGGRFDATNVIQPEACVITNIGIEHTEFLGNTVGEIAGEKAGIIKSGAPVVTGATQPEALEVIELEAKEKGVSLRGLGKEIFAYGSSDDAGSYFNQAFSYKGPTCKWDGLITNLAGKHQVTNGALALGVIELLIEKGVKIPERAVRSGMLETSWPGRLEIVSKNPVTLLDGAHNPAAAKILREFLDSNGLANKKRHWVLGILGDKDWKAMLQTLISSDDQVVFVKLDQDRASDPHNLADFARTLCPNVDVIPSLPKAIKQALETASPDDTVCITGSLYTVGEAKAWLEKAG